MNAYKLNSSWRAVAAAVAVVTGVVVGGTARAGMFSDDEGTPLTLSLDHQISRDSNIRRATNNEYDTVNSTGLNVGLDKSYGRQNYKFSGRVARTSYTKLKQYDNTSHSLSGSFSSGFASNWLLSLGGTNYQSLVPFEENGVGSRTVRNTKKYRDGNASIQYGVSGLWALVGSYDANRLSYDATEFKANNANQHTGGLKMVYYSTDLLAFSVGGRRVETEYPVGRNGLVRTDKNIDFATDWQVTGLSNLSATLTRRQTDYNLSAANSSSGWGGSLSWEYRPQGLLVYNLDLSRYTSADRGKITADWFTNELISLTDSIANTAEARVTLKATEKTYFTGGWEVTRYQQESDYSIQSIFLQPGGKSSSYYHALSLTAGYQALRKVGLTCSFVKYSQSLQIDEREDVLRPRYDGRSFGCAANLKVEL